MAPSGLNWSLSVGHQSFWCASRFYNTLASWNVESTQMLIINAHVIGSVKMNGTVKFFLFSHLTTCKFDCL